MSIGNMQLLSALQLGQAEKTAEAIERLPAVQQAALQEAAEKTLQEQQKLIEHATKSRESHRKNIDEKEAEKKHQNEQEKKRQKNPLQEEEVETQPHNYSPFSGIIINRKV